MDYIETYDVTEKYRQEYVDGFESVIKQKEKEADKAREEYIKGIFNSPEKYREDFKKMLGWPLVDYKAEGVPEVLMMEKLTEDEAHTVYRMRFEILEGLTLTGLFFKCKEKGERPLVITQHGGWGTPEMVAEFYEIRANYNGMVRRVINHGVHAFAPQLLLWNQERYGIEFDRRAIDARLKRVGSSITAVEIFALTRIIDYFEAQDYVKNFGMVGLSYGGFYTLFTTAIDTRIKSAISCSFFNTREQYPWIDWTWNRSAYMFDDPEIACLVYPRTLCLEMGNEDAVFNYEYTLESFEKLKKLCSEKGTDWVNLIIFDGVHEFCKEDAPIEKLVDELLSNYGDKL